MTDIKPDRTEDLKGLNCPMPVLKTKKALDALQPGQVLKVDLTDKGAKTDIPAMLKRTGNELIEMTEEGGVITFLLRKK